MPPPVLPFPTVNVCVVHAVIPNIGIAAPRLVPTDIVSIKVEVAAVHRQCSLQRAERRRATRLK
jgi:hypothetical protein